MKLPFICQTLSQKSPIRPVFQSGFTLVEMTLVAALVTLALIWTAERVELEAKKQLVERRAELLLEAKQSIRRFWLASDPRSAANSRWPTSIDVLDLSKPFRDNLNRFGWTFWPSNEGRELKVHVSRISHGFALANRLGPSAIAESSTYLIWTMTVPGTDLAHFYLLSGARALTGDLNANGSDLNNVTTLDAINIQAQNLVLDAEGSIIVP